MTLTGALAKKERKPARLAQDVLAIPVSGGTPYGRAALERETAELRATPEGERNDRLNRAAFAAGQLVGGRELDELDAERALRSAALDAGLDDEREVSKTLASGMEAGKKEPRSAPPQRENRRAETGRKRSEPANGKAKASEAQDDGDPGEPPAGMFDDEEPTSPATIELVPLSKLIGPALDRAEKRRSGDERPIPLRFREEAEAHGGGLWPGAHFLIAGTGVGKSQREIQETLEAAKAGIPSSYVGLELDEMQVALRAVGIESGVRWSNLATGRCTANQIARARESASALDGLPFYPDFGPTRGYQPSRLVELAAAMRKAHPQGPAQIVLDYLQLMGDDAGTFERRLDLRERVGNAAYAAREIARRYDIAVKVISSVARAHYGLLASSAEAAGLIRRPVPGHVEPVRTIASPDTLIGLGKESGEVEFSADSVTVLVKWPTPLDNGETAVVVCIPKVRWGAPRWFTLAFDGGRFIELPVQDISELPEVTKAGAGERVSLEDLEARLLDAARRFPNLKSRTALVDKTKGKRTELLKLSKDLFDEGRIVRGASGLEVPENPKAGNQ